MGSRAGAVLAAGCDVALHCSGRFAEMVETAGAVGELEGRAEERFLAALAMRRAPEAFDASQAMETLAEVLAVTGR